MSEESTYRCPECDFETIWTMKNVQDLGIPICPECDIDCKLKEVVSEEEESTYGPISGNEEEKSSDELMQHFIGEEELSFEGTSAIESLNKITYQLGYEEQPYRFGSSFEEFIKDNPGCCEKIIDWITENMDKVSEWKENFKYQDEEKDVES